MSAAVYQEPEPEDDRSIQEITQTDYSRPWSPRMMELIAKAKADLADMKKSGGEVLRTASTCVPSLSLLSCHTPTVAVHASLVYVLREREREREMGTEAGMQAGRQTGWQTKSRSEKRDETDWA